MPMKESGKLELSNKGNLKVWQLTSNGEWRFMGVVTRKAIEYLLHKRIRQADICSFEQDPPQ